MAALALEDATRAAALDAVAALLARCGVEDARRDARALLLAAGGFTAAELLLDPAAKLGAAACARLRDYALRRAAREPVSRILGARGFWTQDLLVAPRVLDPRPDTETLIELSLELMGERRREPLRILDLGVGSGAILCALLAELPDARGIGVDLSAAACAAAAVNLSRCGFARRASILRGRWADALAARFDLIVSNPPYIASGELDGLEPEVRLHDPRLALDGGADGLNCYREIAEQLPRLLAPSGAAVLEAGDGQARSLVALLAEKGLAPAGIRKDAGGRERAVAARRRD
ncbi:peptide chain release factor N(5)-glutamine methyltransferase [Methylosinus sporium]|uniref:Release factor glutamine methyltransferase n=1 Tax=Methylosinus sporium TaxID=428 RepID=A0A2U1SN96_METSR|nr:peptide chain release factor N(5)-glutamine methyltransferase [Methylosinus sporium]PWB93080.1 peptide chain release factor N(5)-glutamine methyltransferase [Methylosinus sporium]